MGERKSGEPDDWQPQGERSAPQRSYKNSWQIQEQAAASGLVLCHIMDASIAALEAAGYQSKGFRGQDRGFFTEVRELLTFAESHRRDAAWCTRTLSCTYFNRTP